MQDDIGTAMHGLIAELYPWCRSITGDGLRRTLRRIGDEIPLELHEVPSGTPVLDWTVPREWNVREAWIADPDGQRIVDFERSNLHLVGYSVPVHTRMSLAELRPHLHSVPEQPDVIPYRTSYYAESWGFCLPQRQLDGLREGSYEVCIDATLADGHLTYGELFLPGTEPDELLISCHCCHPSLCNDNLSGIAVATFLARELAQRPRRHGVRFVFIPGTIGSITWLARNEAHLARIRHGLVLTCVGDAGHLTYKRTRRGDCPIDRAFAHLLKTSGRPHEIVPFSPWGYDERQYGSPGFDLPVGCLMRTPHGKFPQYHTSADDLQFVRPEALADSLKTLLAVFDLLERDRTCRNTHPKGEPQLGRRGLYNALGGRPDRDALHFALLWVLNLADGEHSLLDIAERAELPFATIDQAATALEGCGLLAAVASKPAHRVSGKGDSR